MMMMMMMMTTTGDNVFDSVQYNSRDFYDVVVLLIRAQIDYVGHAQWFRW